MNIFEALTEGDGTIGEVNITAVLGFLLISSKNHSMGDSLLLELITIINDGQEVIKLENYSSSEITIEHTYANRKSIDTQIKLINSNDKIFHRIIIENKIKDTAAVNEDQLQEYYIQECKERELRYDTEDSSITVLFITHSNCSNRIHGMFDDENLKIDTDRDSKKHIYWSSDDKEESTIYSAILEVIKKDQMAEINPIHNCTLHTIKSFARHLKSIGSSDNARIKDAEYTREWVDKRDRYKVVDRMSKLKEMLGQELSLSDLDIRDCKVTKFYCKINDDFRISIQSLNNSSMKIRVLIRPVPHEGRVSPNHDEKGKLIILCNNKEGLIARSGGAYAYIESDDNEGIYIDDLMIKSKIIKRVGNINNIFKTI
jgi:hypothetical protein